MPRRMVEVGSTFAADVWSEKDVRASFSAYRFEDVLAHASFEAVISGLAGAGATGDWFELHAEPSEGAVARSVDGLDAEELEIFGAACLMLFVRNNVTGPPVTLSDALAVFASEAVTSWAMRELEIEGEYPYRKTPYPGLLVVSNICLSAAKLLDRQTACWWRMRTLSVGCESRVLLKRCRLGWQCSTARRRRSSR